MEAFTAFARRPAGMVHGMVPGSMVLAATVGSTPERLGSVALKAVLLYATAVLLLRIAERRTLARLSAVDVVVGVALGAIVGRTITSPDTSWSEGALGLAVLIVLHRMLSLLRFLHGVRTFVDHVPRLLVVDGQVQRRQLLRSGVPLADLRTALRQSGVRSLAEVQAAVYEATGAVTVIRVGESGELVEQALRRSANPPPRAAEPEDLPDNLP